MKRKTKLLLIGACLIICLSVVLLFFMQPDPTEEIIYTMVNESFERGTPTQTPENIQPDFAEFLDEYLPMIADASPEVQAVMIQFEPKFRSDALDLEIERFLPTDEWLQKLLDMGITIDNYSDYSGYLNHRYRYWHAHNDPEDLLDTKDRLNLNADASWDDVVEAGIWRYAKLKTLADEAMDADPLVEGGTLSKDGVFIPFRLNTIYIQQNGSQVSSQKGAGVPDWVPRELHHRAAGIPPEREIPKHVEVIFLDDAGKPVDEKVAQSRAQGFQLEPYLIKNAPRASTPVTKSVSTDPAIGDSDNSYESETADEAKRPRPDANPNIDELNELIDSGEIDLLDVNLTPKLPTDMPIESDVEKGLNDVERMLREPESEDRLRRLKQIDRDAANEKEPERQSTPTKAD